MPEFRTMMDIIDYHKDIPLMNMTRKHNILLLLLTFSLIGSVGCATHPQLYTMPPNELEAIRGSIRTVGVSLNDSEAKTVVKLPAKGTGQGIVRGAAAGATMRVIVGILAPIPLSVPAGVLLAPIGAVVGGVYEKLGTSMLLCIL